MHRINVHKLADEAWLSFGSAQPSKVAQFSVGANTLALRQDGPAARRHDA